MVWWLVLLAGSAMLDWEKGRGKMETAPLVLYQKENEGKDNLEQHGPNKELHITVVIHKGITIFMAVVKCNILIIKLII